MNMPNLCGQITIFEGPDGSGKTTIAKNYAEVKRAQYRHHGTYKDCFREINEAMVLSMVGMEQGHDVVLDRCWISEKPYGTIHRPYEPLRIYEVDQRMHERLALRGGAVMVRCLPAKSRVLKTWERRVEDEEVKDSKKMAKVYDWYLREFKTSLPLITYDYWNVEIPSLFKAIERFRPRRKHFVDVVSAGNADAKTVIVSSFTKSVPVWTNFEPLTASQWLTGYLAANDISEYELSWVNIRTDVVNPSDLAWLNILASSGSKIIALDHEVAEWLKKNHFEYALVDHPTHVMHGKPDTPYALAALIKQNRPADGWLPEEG